MRRVYHKTTHEVDHTTGEVVRSESSSSFFVKSRHFVKVFLDQIHLLQNLSSGARALLDLLVVEMEFNNNTVYFSKHDREHIAQFLDKSEHTIRNHIYELQEADIIAKTGSNVYKVNPNLFQKGGDYQEAPTKPRASPRKKDGDSPI